MTEQVDPQEKEPCADLFPSFVPSFCFMWFVKIRYLSLLQYRIRAVLPHSKEVMGSGISGDCNWTDGWTDCVVPFKKWYRTCAHICQCQAATAMHTNNNNQGRVGANFFATDQQHKADSYWGWFGARGEKVLDLPEGFGFIFLELLRVTALEDQSQPAIISSGMSSVIRVGLITASRIILGHWKTANPLNLKDWKNIMV